MRTNGQLHYHQKKVSRPLKNSLSNPVDLFITNCIYRFCPSRVQSYHYQCHIFHFRYDTCLFTKFAILLFWLSKIIFILSILKILVVNWPSEPSENTILSSCIVSNKFTANCNRWTLKENFVKIKDIRSVNIVYAFPLLAIIPDTIFCRCPKLSLVPPRNFDEFSFRSIMTGQFSIWGTFIEFKNYTLVFIDHGVD